MMVNIVCDIDGVVANAAERVVGLYNQRYETSYTIDDIDSWSTLDGDKRFGDLFYDTMGITKTVRGFKPHHDIVYVLKDLLGLDSDELVFVSNRKTGLQRVTDAWIYETIGNYSTYCIGKYSKANFIADVFIDDSYDNCIDYINTNPDSTVILMGRPWNDMYLDSFDYRITYVSDAIDLYHTLADIKVRIDGRL